MSQYNLLYNIMCLNNRIYCKLDFIVKEKKTICVKLAAQLAAIVCFVRLIVGLKKIN